MDKAGPTRIGWPKFPGTLKTIGKPRILIVGVDFSDAPAEDFDPAIIPLIMKLDSVSSYYRAVSRGLFEPTFEVVPYWVRMPNASDHYGTNREGVLFVDNEWQTHHLEHDATDAIKDSIDLADFDAAILLISGGSALSGRSAYATVLDGGTRLLTDGLGNYIVVGIGIFKVPEIQQWKVIVHELNHLMGLEDLYLSVADGWWQGKSPGPFGQQAYVYSASTDSLGWNRWLNGWMPDSQVLCISQPSTTENIILSPDRNASISGYQLIVIRQSKSKVLVIEQLNANGYESSTYPNSVLVYTVDSSTPSGEGPVRLVPRPTPLTQAPLTPLLPDWERFVEAPLISGTYVSFEDWLVWNQSAVAEGSRISLYFGNDAKVVKGFLEAPVPAKKTITCIKGKKIKKVTAINPVCPKGYKKTN